LNTSPAIAAIAAALAAAQAELQNPHRNREVTVQPREGRAYHFSYATLDSILDGVRPILAKHKLALVQTLELNDQRQAMATTLLHASGEWIATSVPMTMERTGNQALGSAMTYARRYGLIALLGLAADEDDDANGADGNEVQAAQQRTPAPRQPQQAAPPQQPQQPQQPQRRQMTAEQAKEAADAKVEFERLTASLAAKLGADEADHQIGALRKRNGDNWRKTLAEVRALDESTPAASR